MAYFRWKCTFLSNPLINIVASIDIYLHSKNEGIISIHYWNIED